MIKVFSKISVATRRVALSLFCTLGFLTVSVMPSQDANAVIAVFRAVIEVNGVQREIITAGGDNNFYGSATNNGARDCLADIAAISGATTVEPCTFVRFFGTGCIYAAYGEPGTAYENKAFYNIAYRGNSLSDAKTAAKEGLQCPSSSSTCGDQIEERCDGGAFCTISSGSYRPDFALGQECERACSHLQMHNPTARTCEPCPSGQVAADGTTSESRTIGGVTYVANHYNRLACEACPAGKVPNTIASRIAFTYEDRYEDFGKCICAEGTVTDGTPRTDGNQGNGCMACPAGQQPNTIRSACIPSPPSVEVCANTNQEYDSASGACVNCLSHERFNRSRNECEACPLGHVPNSAGTSCTDCPSGQSRTNNPLQTSCTKCPAGHFEFSGECRPCPGNSARNDEGVTFCNTCRSGRAPNDDKTMCVCPENQMGAVDGQLPCTECAGNEISNSDRTSCEPAPPSPSVCRVTKEVFNNGRCEKCPGYQFLFRTICLTCTAGHVQNPDDGSVCVDCPDGQGRTQLQVACTPCPVGEYANAADTDSVCTACPEGQVSTSPGSDSCEVCQGNREATAENTCRCPENFEGAINGSAPCVACAGNEISNPERTACIAAAPSTQVCAFTHQEYDSTADVCVSCPAHEFFHPSDEFCQNCPSGEVQSSGITTCTFCPDGQGRTNNPLETSCTDCPAGQFSNNGGLSNNNCTTCPDGQVAASAGSGSCTACDSNREANANHTACVCPDGQEGAVGISGACTACAADEISNSNRTACVPAADSEEVCHIRNLEWDGTGCGNRCDNHRYYDTSSRLCENCPSGHLQDTNDAANSACSVCPDGQGRTNTPLRTSCSDCPVGQFSDNGVCTTCPGESIAPSAKTASCTDCQGGRVADDGKTRCICPLNFEGTINGSAPCIACAANEVSNADRNFCEPATPSAIVCAVTDQRYDGSSACVDCASHEYFNHGNNTCTNCPNGHIQNPSDKDNPACTACDPGQERTNSPLQTSCADCPVGQFSNNGVCTACTGESIATATKTASCTNCQGNRLATADKTQCLCPMNFQGAINGTSNCVACAGNEVSNSPDNTTCVPAVPSANVCSFTDQEYDGSSACVECESYEYFNHGNNTCTNCPAGHVQNPADKDNSACMDCGAGEGRTNSPIQTSCTNCPAGQFSNSSNVCTACQGESVATSPGSSSCTSCQGGRVAEDGNTRCLCPLNQMGPINGSAACTPCTASVEVSNRDRTACEPATPSAEVCSFTSQEFVNGACVDCESYEYFNQTNNTCMTCPAGHIQNPSDKDNSACMDCGNGEGRTNSPLQTSCTNCPAGQFSNSSNVCTTCQGESIATSPGSSSCTSCQGDRVANSGKTQCTCPDNHAGLVGVSGTCTACANDKVSNADSTICVDAVPSSRVCAFSSQEFANGSCVPCAGHEYFNQTNNTCTACPVGHVQNPDNKDSAACLVCPEGEGRTGSERSCTDCRIGQFSNNGVCTACSDDSISTSAGTAACTTCQGDREANAGRTQCVCPEGQEGAVGVSGACTACSTGEVSNPDRTDCVVCPAGEARIGSGNECAPCTGSGMVPNADVSACVPCPAGQYAVGNTQCEACPAGQFTSDTGNTSCTSCPSGQVARGTGNTSCTACGAGERTVNDGGDCQACPNGQQPTAAKDSCSACPTGYAGTGGTCTECEVGQRTINNQSACEACTDGQQPSTDGTRCEQCSVGTAGTSGTCERCDRTSIATTAGLTSCTACADDTIANGLRNECVTCLEDQITTASGCQTCPLGQTPNPNIDACIPFAVSCPPNQIPGHDGAGGTCMSCPDGEIPDGTRFGCEACPSGQVPTAAGLSCLSCNGGTPNDAGSACVCREDQISSDNSCACPSGEADIQDPSTNTAFCARPIVEVAHPAYNSDECEALFDGRSLVSIDRETTGGFAELCNIRVGFVLIGADGSNLAANVRNDSPISPDETPDSCVMRESPDYLNTAGHRDCEFIFGEAAAFPRLSQSSTFFTSPNARLSVYIQTAAAETPTIPPVRTVIDPTIDTTQGGSAEVQQLFGGVLGTDNRDEGAVLAVALGTFAFVGGLTWALTEGDWTLLNVSPHFAVDHFDGIGHYTYGSRVDFSDEYWHTYWSVSQTHYNGEAGNWIYGAGASWSDGIWRASFSNLTFGLETELSFSAQVRQSLGTWNVNTGVGTDWRLSELNNDWSSRLSLGGSTTVRSWQLIPSAGFSWDEDSSLGDEGYIRLDISREL